MSMADRGAGPGGSERVAEDKRRHVAETERHNTYKDFQGKLEKETEKVSLRASCEKQRQCIIW